MKDLEKCSNISKVTPIIKLEEVEYMVRYFCSKNKNYETMKFKNTTALNKFLKIIIRLDSDVEVYEVKRLEWNIVTSEIER